MRTVASLHRLLLDVLTACVRVSARHAAGVLAAGTAASIALLAYTVTHLGINTDTAGMLDPDLPFQRAAQEFNEAFPVLNDQMVVVVESAQGGAAAAAADELAARLRDHADLIQSVYQPGGGDYFATHGLLYLDEDELWSVDERLAEAAPFLGILARDPSLRGLFDAMTTGLAEGDAGSHRLLARMFDRISTAVEAELAGAGRAVSWRDELFPGRSGDTAVKREFLLLKPLLDFTSVEPAARALELVRGLGREVALRHAGVRVRITGDAAMNSEELVTVSRDATLTMVLAFVLVCLLLVWGLRSAGGVVAVLYALLLGLIWTGAFATAAVGALNLISVTFAVLFIGMGVDFGIQFALRYQEECDRGARGEAALCAAVAGVGGALTLAAAGAAASFLAFVPTSYRGLAELGVIAAFSMLVALLTSVTLLPAALSLLPAPKRRVMAAVATAGEAGLLHRWRRWILGSTGVAIAAAAVLAPHVRFDFNPLNLKDPTTDSVAMFRELAADPDTSPYTIQIVARDLDAAVALALRLEALPTVDKALTLMSYVPADQEAKLGIIDGLRLSLTGVLPPTAIAVPPTAAERLAALERFSAALPNAAGAAETPVAASMTRLHGVLTKLAAAPGGAERHLPALERHLVGDLGDTLGRLERALEAGPVSVADLPGDLRMRYVAADGRARVEVFPRHDLSDNRALATFVRDVQAVAPEATDAPVELLEAGGIVIRSCLEAAALALAFGLVMNAFVLRSVAGAVLAAVPLLLATVLTTGATVLVGAPFNFANIIAMPLMIALANAYGVYLVMRRQATADLVQLMVSSTPRAVLLSGLTTMASFGTLALATHPGMSGMGVLISLSLGVALLSSLVVLPALMAELDARRRPLSAAES
jgi:hypothetical protein